MSRTWSITLAAPIAAALAISCNGGEALPPPEIPRPPQTAAPAAPPAPKGPELLPAQILAQVEDEYAMPAYARRAEGGMLLFAAKKRWLVRPVDAEGKPKSAAPLDVAAINGDATMSSLKPVGDGYLAAWAESGGKNQIIKALSLDLDGKPRGDAVTITQITEAMSWLDVIPNARGALVLWDVPHDDRFDVFVAPWANGKVEGAPQTIARDVIGYEAEPTAKGAALVTVTSAATPAAAPAKGKKKPARTADEAMAARGGRLGKVFFAEVDDKGKVGATVLVSGEPTAQVDVTVAEVSGKYVVAWTDERNIDACVYLATVEPGGKVASQPRRATPPFGEQALVSLVAEPYSPGAPRSKRALIAWEEQLRVQREGRLLHLATIGPDGQIGKERASLIFSASGPPDIEPDGEGFAVVTLAPVRELPAGVEAQPQQGVKSEGPVWPAFVRFGPDLSVIASEPLRAEAFAKSDGVPYLTRGLACGSSGCTTLGVGAVEPAKGADTPAVPAPIALLSLPARETPWRAPARRDADEAPPRATSVTALFDGDHLARVAATEVPGGVTLAAWVTYVLEAAGSHGGKGKKGAKKEEEGPSATLMVRSIGADNAPGKTVTISKKAVSEGGIALAPAPAREGKKPEIALAWVARERGEPQVFLTKLGADGEKTAQKGLTMIQRKKKGSLPSEASDVALAYAGGEGSGGDGWIAAWVDSRDGNSEIYAAKVDRSLGKTIPDQRLTNAPGDSVEVQLVVRGKEVFLVWSDARGNPDEGSGDIYLAKLDAATLKKSGPEVRLHASAAHSRTPQIMPYGKGFLVSWIEEGADAKGAGDPGADAGLYVALLDEKGALVGAPERVRGEGGAVTSAAVTCGARLCRGVITSASGEVLTMGAFDLNPGSPAGPVKTIAALTGAGQDASPVFAGPSAGSLFFADDAVSGTGRVRWMALAWP